MKEELTRARLVATGDDLDLELGQRYEECLHEDEYGGHQFYDVLGQTDIDQYVKNGYKIFILDVENNMPTIMVFDGTNWLEDTEPNPEAIQEASYDVASVDGLLAVAELMQSEMEAVAVALQSVDDTGVTKPINTLSSLDTTKKLTSENPIQALVSKLMLGRMAFSTGNIFDISNAAKKISDNETADLPTIFYENDPRPIG